MLLLIQEFTIRYALTSKHGQSLQDRVTSHTGPFAGTSRRPCGRPGPLSSRQQLDRFSHLGQQYACMQGVAYHLASNTSEARLNGWPQGSTSNQWPNNNSSIDQDTQVSKTLKVSSQHCALSATYATSFESQGEACTTADPNVNTMKLRRRWLSASSPCMSKGTVFCKSRPSETCRNPCT